METISVASVQRFLKFAGIKPWKNRYWLNSPEKHDDPEALKKIEIICSIYLQATELAERGTEVYSTDEMTGIQALERRYPDKPVRPGSPVPHGFEYIRHGTISLAAFLRVANIRLAYLDSGTRFNK